LPAGTKDYTAIISQFKSEGVDIVAANMVAPDFGVLWNQFHQQGFIPKVMNIGKAIHFTSDITAFGGRMGHGLICEDEWEPFYPYTNSLTGQTAAELSAEWTEFSGKPADCTIGYDWSTFEVIYDVYTRCKTLDREKVRQALSETDLDTSYGRIKYDERNVGEVPIIVSQWVVKEDGTIYKNVIANRNFEEIPLSDEEPFFIPGSK
jgi:branched-chain amino acid transport system substrate-binding protein